MTHFKRLYYFVVMLSVSSDDLLMAHEFIPLIKGNYIFVRDISSDGSTVVGDTYGPYGAMSYETRAFVWTYKSGIQLLDGHPGGSNWAMAVNQDGSIIAGSAIWRSGESPEVINVPNSVEKVRFDGISESGEFLAGSAYLGEPFQHGGDSETVIYSETHGIRGLGILGGNPSHMRDSRAWAVSADGEVVVGQTTSDSGLQAFRWTEETGMVGLGTSSPGINFTNGSAVSADGKSIVGAGTVDGNPKAVLWTEQLNTVSLGALRVGDSSVAHDISADGQTVVGTNWGINGFEAFIWQPQSGMKSLRQMLVDDGVDLGQWQLEEANGVSGDGRVITGYMQGGASFVVILDSNIPEPSALAMVSLLPMLILRRGVC